MRLQRAGIVARLLSQWQIQAMAWCGIIFILVFAYIPMVGIVMAFKDMDHSFSVIHDLIHAPWVGLTFFKEFFHDDRFADILKNTVGLNLLQLLINFPAPIIFAIMISEVFHTKLKKFVQSLSYLPHFLSWIVFGGIIITLVSQDSGVVNPLLIKLGFLHKPFDFLGDPNHIWGLIIVTSLLKGLGWGSIIYLAAITSIDTTLFEAATIDGAGRFNKIWNVTLPSISGTILIFFLLSIGNLLNSSFDQIWIFQSPLNLERSEVIDTFVYRVGIKEMRFSYTTAVGVFKSLIALLLLISGHYTSKKIAGRGLF
ncbi:putative aldouronate transport system permease protein [Paenibacillus sp. yr247]|uniref:ABC transporter permease n=1 Tax=Paenibacillus sp. yr247 TaxID=1761880 RepID=UPI00088366B2|nr:ABC transporter permease subunit [Paenibacillus sp. yr247]SDO19353.1 putative aldouronate transport system permease protein [Paenibacillus sp. yr247]